MSLDKIKSGEVSFDDNGSSNSKSGSGSSGSYPKSELRVPTLAIYENEDGELVAGFNDENAAVEYRKESEDDSWERHMVPHYIERYWMSRNSVRMIAGRVERHLNEDLYELLEEDPEAALKAIIKAAKINSPAEINNRVVDCAVCGKSIHLVHDKYEEVNNRRVCPSHNVEELAAHDLI